MSGKNQFPVVYNWQASDPSNGFLPNPIQGGSIPSGVIDGVMDNTDTIYSQIIDVSKMDNLGLEVTWTGSPTGDLSVMASVSGANFYALTFNPALSQPGGSDGGFVIGITQFPFKYIMLKYVNASGTGILNVYEQNKDLN